MKFADLKNEYFERYDNEMYANDEDTMKSKGKGGLRWLVVVDFDCRLGSKGTCVSRHRTYEAAKLAAKRTGLYNFLSIKERT